MLTADDLAQIRLIVREEVQLEGQKIRKEFREEIAQLEFRILKIEVRITALEKRVSSLEKCITILEKEVKQLRQLLNEAVDYFDKRHGAVVKRLERIEKHIGIYNPADPLVIYDRPRNILPSLS